MRKQIKRQLRKIAFDPYVFFKYNMIISYGFGFLISLMYFEGEYIYYTLRTMLIVVSGFLLFSLGWKVALKVKINPISYRASKKIAHLFSVVFIGTAVYIFYYTTPAILAGMLGSDFAASELRAMATKGKTGLDSFINGFFYVSSYIGISALALFFFYENKRFKWLLLLLVIFLLMLNGQKSRFIIVVLPIVMLFIQRGKFKQVSRLIMLSMTTLFLAMLSLSFLEIGTNTGHEVIIGVHDRLTTGGRDLFPHQTPLTFIIHRLIWIPYITAVDWFRYIDTVLTENLMGASIPLLSNILDLERINLDNEVFKFQFNVSSGSLGAANTFFPFDLIANFGYISLIIFPFIFGVIFGIIWKGLPRPLNLFVFVWLFAFQASSFQALFLGGGMFIVLGVILVKNIIKPKQYF